VNFLETKFVAIGLGNRNLSHQIIEVDIDGAVKWALLMQPYCDRKVDCRWGWGFNKLGSWAANVCQD